MFKFIKKFKKSLIVAAAAITLLTPAMAAAAGEVYYWQDSGRSAIVATGGVYKSTTTVLTGPPPSFTASQAVDCNSGSSQGDVTLKVAAADYKAKAEPTPGTLSVSCDSGADVGSVQVYANQSAATASSSADGPSCKGGLLSYIVCPVYDFILSSIKTEEDKVIAPLLQLSPLTTNTNSPPHLIWTEFRNLANVGFILAFLIIIFAHTLSIGIDNYSLKKTLPRLVYAAILVQFSYILVAAGVDFTNILGAGVQGIVLAPLHGNSTLVVNGTNGIIAGGVEVGLLFAAVGSVITGSILVVLFGAFFAVLGVLFTLVARQILVILLLILSPIAIVAWVLPNTEHLFKLWRTSLIRLLLMYPMIILLFAAGKLFSAAAIATSNTGASGATTNAFLPLISIIAYILPLFFIPFTFKYAGMAMQTMSGWIHGASMGAHKRAISSQRYEKAKARVDQRRTELAAGQKVNFLNVAQIGGGQFTKRAARGAYSLPGKGSNIQALVAFNKDVDAYKKRLEEENMTYEGYSYMSLGDGWYNDEYGKIEGKISTAEASRVSALAAGDVAGAARHENEVNVQTEARRRLVEGKQFGSVYSKNMAARAAAFLKRSLDMDVIEDKDREAVMDYTGFNKDTQLGRLLGDQLWTRGREGARKTNVHLVHTDSRGNLDVDGLEKYLAKKPAGSWVEFTKEAVEKMDEAKILERMAKDSVSRQILINTLSHTGGPSIGAEQQKIITKVLKDTGSMGLKDDGFWT